MAPIQSMIDATRFYAHVRKGESCWEWLPKDPKKYKQDGVRWPLARAAWIVGKGCEPPAGRSVGRICLNPRCVNPAHLVIGQPKSCKPLRERVEDGLDKSCDHWRWMGRTNESGGGRIDIGGKADKWLPGVLWALAKGLDPAGDYRIERCCKVDGCVNPDHWREDTRRRVEVWHDQDRGVWQAKERVSSWATVSHCFKTEEELRDRVADRTRLLRVGKRERVWASLRRDGQCWLCGGWGTGAAGELIYRRMRGVDRPLGHASCGNDECCNPAHWVEGRREKTRASIQRRFWSHVERMPSGCWEWRSTRDCQGYGQITIGGGHVAAHRYACEMARGTIPAGMLVRHLCDNKLCVNPRHLVIGTHVENMADMRGKPQKKHRRFTDVELYAIREDYERGGTSYRALAVKYGCHHSTIKVVLAGGEISNGQWQRVLEMHGHACARCGARGVAFHRDHIVRVADGGASDDANLQPLCTPCHRKKCREEQLKHAA